MFFTFIMIVPMSFTCYSFPALIYEMKILLNLHPHPHPHLTLSLTLTLTTFFVSLRGGAGATKIYLILTWVHSLSLLLEREERGERETLMRERSIDWLPPMCPDWGLYMAGPGTEPVPWPAPNLQPFGYGTILQPTEPCWPGHKRSFIIASVFVNEAKLFFIISTILLMEEKHIFKYSINTVLWT